MDGSIYVNRESGALVKIGPVDDSYAQQVVLTGPAAGGLYKMPIADYDQRFVEWFRPAGPSDLLALDDDSARPPANATPAWLEEGDPGQRTLASAIARLERKLADARHGIETLPDGGTPHDPYASGLEDALAELRAG